MSKDSFKLHGAIANRAFAEIRSLNGNVGRVSLLMDLESVPDLDLEQLLASDPFTFSHDICGIIRHMDRSSYPGRLVDCFVPRCSRRVPA